MNYMVLADSWDSLLVLAVIAGMWRTIHVDISNLRERMARLEGQQDVIAGILQKSINVKLGDSS